MQRKVFFVLLPLALVFAVVTSASAQEPTVVAKVKVPFEFTVGKTIMPAGVYEFLESSAGGVPNLVLRTANKPDIMVATVTRLAEPDPPLTEPKLVFDTIAGRNHLSEVWPVDRDGYLLSDPIEKHTHKTVKGEMRPRT